MSTPLPDDIRDAIAKAARQVKRRSDHRFQYDRGDDLAPPDDSLDSFTEDIEDQLTLPVGELVSRRDTLEADLAARAKPLPPGYWSFLVCSYPTGTNLYINGRPLTQADGQPIKLRDIADPCSFGTVAELKAELHGFIDRMVIAESPVKLT